MKRFDEPEAQRVFTMVQEDALEGTDHVVAVR